MLNTKLPYLLGVLAIGIFSLNVSVASDNLDDTLRQALFLVELLKTDFTQILREKSDVTANSTEDENSTCSLPLDDYNTTIAMNETEVTASGMSSKDVASMTPSTQYTPTPLMTYTPPPSMSPGAPIIMPDMPPGAPMMMPNTPPGAPMMMPNMPPGAPMMMPNTPPGAPMMMPNMPPGAPMMMPYASWPAMPMGFPSPPGPARRNFQDENYRFPYTFNRRRMMPDYYYYDSPIKIRGNFRRFGNDPNDGFVTPATSQAPITTSMSTAATEATTLNVGETTASATSLTTTKSELSTSILSTNSANRTILQSNAANQVILQTNPANQTILQSTSAYQTISANQTVTQTNPSSQLILPTNSTNPSILATSDPADQTVNSDQILTANGKSVLSSLKSTKQSILRTTKRPKLRKIKQKSLKTKPRKRVKQRKRVPASKDIKTPLITNGVENHYNVRNHHLRQLTTEDYVAYHKPSELKNLKENVEMVQVASELEKEFNYNDNIADKSNGQETEKPKITKKTTSSKKTTMKVFLQGSSRIPVPFPENNVFCYFYPKNALCGSHL